MTNWEKFVHYNHEVCGMQYEEFGVSPDVDRWGDEFVLCVECGDVVTKEDFERSGYETACPICCWDWDRGTYNYQYEYDEDDEDEED